MRKKIVAGNWKMNKSQYEANKLANELAVVQLAVNVEVIVIPTSIFISEVKSNLQNSSIKLGVQNTAGTDNGAYTGEISAAQIKSAGIEYALVGHSERREYFNESNKDLVQKINQLLAHSITPIYCCGEVLAEREKGNHFNLVKTQIEEGLFHLSETELLNCVIAYEPVWAIGTGVTASSDQAQEMHGFIRSILVEKYGQDIANKISILYGGSCKPSNAQELFANSDVDGGLIGGASLVAESFAAIVNSF